MATIESDLKEREYQVTQRENNAKEFEKHLDKEQKDIDNQKKQLSKLRETIDEEKIKERSDLRKEIDFLKNSISEYNRKIELLKTEITDETNSKNDKINEAYNNKMIELEKKYRSQTEENIKNTEKLFEQTNKDLNNSIKWHNDELEASFKKILETYEEMLKSKQMFLDKGLSDLEETSKKLENEIKEYSNVNQRNIELDIKDKKLNLIKESYDKIIEKEVSDKHNDLIEENNQVKKQLDDLRNKYIELENEKNKLYEMLMDTDRLDLNTLKNENDYLKKSNEDFIKKYGKYTDINFIDIKVKAEKYDNLLKKVEDLSKEKLELEKQVSAFQFDQQNIDALRFSKEHLEQELLIERTHFKTIKEEYNALITELGENKESVLAAKAIETEIPEFYGLEQNDAKEIDEIKWLNKIINDCAKAGYQFSKRLFYSFHTCLKTSDMSPLTVLAGVSGTGKSKLPQLYSKFGGIYFLSLAVQPDWDSPQSLFGYYNSIEKRFNATTLLRALVSFQKDKSDSPNKETIYDLSDNVLIVLLDEMNLAHVELYFSDLLSKLELKRDENEKVCFEVDLGASNEKYKVYLTDNVKWVGTMNEDETTKSLSDKVIDRGNVISFPRPEQFVRYTEESKSSTAPKIKKEVWENWLNSKTKLTEEEANHYMKIVQDINNQLMKVNRALGHRVWQSIEDYMMSHPLVNSNSENKEKREKALNYAFEEALVQKVMTKLRGIECDGEQREALNEIKNILDNAGLSSIDSDFENALESVTGTFVWDSAKYLNKEYNLE